MSKLKNPIRCHVFKVVYTSLSTGKLCESAVIDDGITTPMVIESALKGIGENISIRRTWQYVENPLLK